MNTRKVIPAACFLLLSAMAARAGEYPAALPPEEAVRKVLNELPQVKAARAGVDLEEANAGRLRAGAYEWTVKAGVQRRTENAGTRYRENEIAIERPVRWFGKAEKDKAIGEHGVKLAGFALADAWHESGRTFLKAWFDTMRDARAAARLQEDASLTEQQAAIVRKRFKAGDAPRVELMLAETEHERAVAAQRQAARRAERSIAELRVRYPAATFDLPQALPLPTEPGGTVAEWKQRILAENHEIELANAEAERSKLNAQRAALDRMPDPTVGVRMAHERDSQEKIVGVTFSMPLPGTARRSSQDASAAQARIAEERAHQAALKVESDAAGIAMSAEAAYETWQKLAQVANRMKDNAEVVSKAYSLGEIPLGDLLLARRQAIEAGANAEAAQFDALEAQARLLLDAHLIWDFER